MNSVFDSGSSGQSSSPRWDHCIVFLFKSLYECLLENNEMLGRTPRGSGTEAGSRGLPPEPEINASMMSHSTNGSET